MRLLPFPDSPCPSQIYNHLPMAMLLPPAIRPYWSVLTKEKAQAPSHRDWEYSSNPFDARKEVDNRQQKREEKQQVQASIAAGETDSRARTTEAKVKRGWENVPEVKMTQSQRELVEDVIRRVSEMAARAPAPADFLA